MRVERNSVRRGAALRLALDAPLLSREEERALFRRRKSLVSRAEEMQARIDRGEAAPALCERVEALQAEAVEVRNRIVEANLRLVVSVASKFAGRATPVGELVSDCLPPLLRAVELFDVEKGCCFSTYATHAVRNAIGRALQRNARRRERMATRDPAAFDAEAEDGGGRSAARAGRVTSLSSRALGLLPPRERTILAARFGLDGFTHEHTFGEIGGLLGLSKERARVLAHRSIDTLQSHFRDRDLESCEDYGA